MESIKKYLENQKEILELLNCNHEIYLRTMGEHRNIAKKDLLKELTDKFHKEFDEKLHKTFSINEIIYILNEFSKKLK